ncbi:sphingosine hydroxylase [Maudiozyma humilis]|uniref:Sphingosine hydroxylase n=1 Tax=Maudiozyma humilis TaxID=51915 RepID=A0AAV5RS87_MAUHU|nr:sphingosine hydroxylase [Kazachstania humilis]
MSANSTITSSGLAYLQSAIEPAVSVSLRPTLIEGVPDGIVAILAPVVAYWAFSGMFHLFDTLELAEKYRIHPKEAVDKANKASRVEVLREVLLQHVIQSLVAYVSYKFDPVPTTGFEQNAIWHLKQSVQRSLLKVGLPATAIPDVAIAALYNYGIPAFKLAFCFVFVDTWQFFLHRLMHLSSTLYAKFHSVHHRLYIPYAYGALYNAPVEGFLLDTLGTGIAMNIAHLTPREQIILFVFATMKTIDDHCGYVLPLDPFQLLFPNNAVYHDIHHQPFGLKSNFAQPFFTFWDELFDTKFKAMDSELEHGKKVNIHEYKQFLRNRDAERKEKLAKFKGTLEGLDEQKADEGKKKDM